jgi:hypothetical protein
MTTSCWDFLRWVPTTMSPRVRRTLSIGLGFVAGCSCGTASEDGEVTEPTEVMDVGASQDDTGTPPRLCMGTTLFAEARTEWTLGPPTQALVAADMDGDGLLDLVATLDLGAGNGATIWPAPDEQGRLEEPFSEPELFGRRGGVGDLDHCGRTIARGFSMTVHARSRRRPSPWRERPRTCPGLSGCARRKAVAISSRGQISRLRRVARSCVPRAFRCASKANAWAGSPTNRN